MKVSVLIPVYNAAKTLSASLDSLSAQTFRDFEVIFVDDNSNDGSREIIDSFVSSGIDCKVVSREKNGGVASARNAGLDVAAGEYVAWLDADDFMAPELLSKAASLAEEKNSDIVGWDWTLGFEKNGRYMRQPVCSMPVEAIKNLMGGVMRWNLWLFMVRRDLVEKNGIRFIDGANMGEDMMFLLRCLLCADTFVQIHESLYSYNAVSTTSISRQFSEARRREVETNVNELVSAVEASSHRSELAPYVQYLKLYIKLPLLIGPNKTDYEIWYSWFPESNKFAAANKSLPLRTRALQWCAARRLWLLVKAYYILVYKFVYGIIFR